MAIVKQLGRINRQYGQGAPVPTARDPQRPLNFRAPVPAARQLERTQVRSGQPVRAPARELDLRPSIETSTASVDELLIENERLTRRVAELQRLVERLEGDIAGLRRAAGANGERDAPTEELDDSAQRFRLLELDR